MPHQSNTMTLFKITLERGYKDIFLNFLSEMRSVHIKIKLKPKNAPISKSDEDTSKMEKIKKLRENLTTLLSKLKISESDLHEVDVPIDHRPEFVVKDINELINYAFEEVNFFLNRINELDRYIAKAKIELERTYTLNFTYHFLDKYNLNWNETSYFKELSLKIYTTFAKNLINLKNILKFEEIPCIYQVSNVIGDRIAFFVIYPKDKEEDIKERIGIIHAEEIPILKKYFSQEKIEFLRISKELELIEATLSKYQKEIERIRTEDLLKFAAIDEIINNIEKYNWAEQQFEEISENRLILKFFIPTNLKSEIKQKLTETFNDKIIIESIEISKKRQILEKGEFEEQKLKENENNRFKPKEPIKENTTTEDIEKNEEKKEEQKDLRDQTPTIMKHKSFIKPFESLTRMYGTPSYSEIDPTPFLFITFPLLFGLMFGDIGHGMVLVIAGFIGSRVYKKRGGDIYNFSWIIFTCGWWAMLGGLLYGEFFGNNNVFGYPLEPIPIPILFLGWIVLQDPLNNIMAVFIFVVLIGVVHINLGWFLEFLNEWKQNKRYKGFSEGIMKILFLTGGVVLLLVWGLNIQSWMVPPFPILLPLIPGILLILLKPIGKIIGISYMKKEKFASLIGEGSMDTFETFLSVPGNVLSYIRILALVLAHLSLMLAIKAMAEAFTPKNQALYIQVIVQIIIIIALIFGNAMVIILEGMLVFINAMRLHFYEFFFKFYRGEGIEFRPFSLNNKYSRIIFKPEPQKDIISEEFENLFEVKKSKDSIEKAIKIVSDKFLR